MAERAVVADTEAAEVVAHMPAAAGTREAVDMRVVTMGATLTKGYFRPLLPILRGIALTTMVAAQFLATVSRRGVAQLCRPHRATPRRR